MTDILWELWEVPHPPQKKVLGIGYSSKYLTGEDKKHLSYRLWHDMIYLCYGIGKTYDQQRRGKKYTCCNSWLDYQKFLLWFEKNYNKNAIGTMRLTKCVIGKDNTMFNPNNCAVVPTEIHTYFEAEDANTDKAVMLADKYKDCITEDIYEILTEEY